MVDTLLCTKAKSNGSLVSIISGSILPLLMQIITAGEELPQRLTNWLSDESQPDGVVQRNGANVRIAFGPRQSWFAFDGMSAFYQRYNMTNS